MTENGNSTIRVLVDWIDDTYFIRADPAFGETMVADNLSLALNLIDLAAGDIGEIPGVQPVTVHQFASGVRVVEVTAGRRRAAKLEPAALPLGKFAIGGIDNADFVAR